MKKNVIKMAECAKGHKIIHSGSIKKGSDKGTEVPKLCVRCRAPIKNITKLKL